MNKNTNNNGGQEKVGTSLRDAALKVLRESALGPNVAYADPPKKLNPAPEQGSVEDTQNTNNVAGKNIGGLNIGSRGPTGKVGGGNTGPTDSVASISGGSKRLNPETFQGDVEDLGQALTDAEGEGADLPPVMRANDRVSRTTKVPGGNFPAQEKYNPTDRKIFAEAAKEDDEDEDEDEREDDDENDDDEDEDMKNVKEGYRMKEDSDDDYYSEEDEYYEEDEDLDEEEDLEEESLLESEAKAHEAFRRFVSMNPKDNPVRARPGGGRYRKGTKPAGDKWTHEFTKGDLKDDPKNPFSRKGEEAADHKVRRFANRIASRYGEHSARTAVQKAAKHPDTVPSYIPKDVMKKYGSQKNEEYEPLLPEDIIEIGVNSVNVHEHMNALLSNGGNTLSEEFKEKTSVVFEAALREMATGMYDALSESFAHALDEAAANFENALIEQVDNYLGYVVEQWIAENEVAIESGLRSELTEEFITGLHKLFAENYVDVPESKVDLVEALAEKVNKLEDKLNEEFENSVRLREQLVESKKNEVFVSVTRDLTDFQADKLGELSKNVVFESVDDYADKILTLKESYFTAGNKKSSSGMSNDRTLESVDPTTAEAEKGSVNYISEDTNPRMARYLNTLSRQVKSPTFS